MHLLQGKRPHGQRLRKTEKEKEKDAQQGKSTQKKTYPECGTCGKKNHPEERCWQVAGAHLKPKRTRPEDSTENKDFSIQRLRNLRPNRHHRAPNPHILMMSQKTNFATTPI